RQSNLRGYITFAMGGKDTRTTQVFINLKDNSRLDAMGFPPFGKVIEGGMQVAGLFYSGYGESPDQGMIQSKGNAYLGPKFPKLDKIKSATIVP
ncbi:MAG: peptidylprolyl isomerase, partial [Acidobacteria bacterium]|nr:peptidylprolyl isomerase [Acidobacteriota bacterium]